MPELPKKKLKIYDLDKMSVEDRAEALKPVIEEHNEEFSKIGAAMAEMANSNLFEALKSITTTKFPIVDLLESIKIPELPAIPDMYPDVTSLNFERYDPPVTIKKTKWEIEKEEREAYMTELQIQILEQQLNLVKGMQAPQYDLSSGVITFLGKQIEIPLNTNLEMVCRVVLKNSANMKRKWSWDEIIEANRENPQNFTSRQIYMAVRTINEKVAVETQVKNLLLTKPITTIQLNPQFLAK